MSSKATMRAVSVGEPGHGGPELLYVADDVPRPELKSAAHLLVKIKATALNRADTIQRYRSPIILKIIK